MQDDKSLHLLIEEAVALEEPFRTERFNALIEDKINNDIRGKLVLALNRITLMGKHVDGFLPKEHAYFHNKIIRGFHNVLGDDYFIEYLRDEKRWLDDDLLQSDRMLAGRSEVVFYDPNYFREKERNQHNSRLREWIIKIIERVSNPDNLQSSISSFEGPKPQFKTEILPTIFDYLKEYFPEPQYADLENILNTGGNVNRKLLFKDDAKVLTDVFRKLYENRFIIGCKPETLILWIINNFQFLYKGKPCDFKESTTKKYISEDVPECRFPLIQISAGKVIKYEGVRKKNYNK